MAKLLKNILNPVITEDIEEIIRCDIPWETLYGKTILVTGASGMIPSYVVYTLLQLNDCRDMHLRVLGMARNREKAQKILGPLMGRDDFDLIIQDVCTPFDPEENIDYIFHGGSAARPASHKTAPVETIRANTIGTFNLLDLAVRKKAAGFVLFSSSEVYGSVTSADHNITEDMYGFIDILNPRSCYSEGKRAAETICACYTAQYGMRCVMPRFAHIYGPGMALDDGRVQAEFASCVIHDQDIVLNSDGSSVRAYTYVADAVSGMFYLLLNSDETACNVADSGGIVSIRELAEAFIAARPEKNLHLHVKASDKKTGMYNPASFIALDDSKLKSLGWSAAVDLRTGIDRTLSYHEYYNK
ncbi:MAG: NAD-dependent epimerase/dehydratase family protein [Anaerovoracaceae bacterium]|jgi:UDP-glucuronate decarboxylase